MLKNIPGTGIKWTQHLKDNGYDVSTTIVGEFDDKDAAKVFALKFSEDNNIVKSDNWLNSIPECGSFRDNFTYVNEQGLNRPEAWSIESRDRHRQASIASGNKASSMGVGIHALSPLQRSENGKKGSKKSQEACMEKFGHKSYFSIANKDPELNERKKQKFKEIGHQQGEKNNQYGSCWIKNNDLQMNKKIRKDRLGMYLDEGWTAGRKMGWPSHKD